MGLLSLFLAACDQGLLSGMGRAGDGDYEVLALIAE
jgi:hypothetical protein